MKKLKCNGQALKLDHTIIMGVLNVTPDSFYDGGMFFTPEKAIARAQQMIGEGAEIIDIGGESSKPGSKPISEKEELKRILPVVKALLKERQTIVSVDSYRESVQRKCLELGTHIINDIYGFRSQEMLSIAREFKAACIVMHMQGKPETMQKNPRYKNVVFEIRDFFKERIAVAEKHGIKNLIIDPGIGFGKTLEHNLQILHNLSSFKSLGKPVLVGVSRKSFIGKIANVEAVERLPGTIAANTLAISNGASILRVHDVKECKQAVLVAEAILNTKK